jgi:HicB family/Sigma-70, region 4
VLEGPAGLPYEGHEVAANGQEVAVDGELEDKFMLAGAFDVLDETERRIVYLRFVQELSRREVAARLGMSADQLRRRTREALAKLRAEIEEAAFPGVDPEEPAKEGEPEPLEQPASETKMNGDERQPSGPSAPGERSGRILLRMPPAVHDELAQAAEREGVSLNQFINNALGTVVASKGSAPPEAPAPRWLPAAIVTNIVVLALAAIAAVALLVVAWQQGW